MSDNLEHTLCYDRLTSEIRDKINTKEFNLIEHLSYEIYQIIKSQIQNQAKISVHITKDPQIQGLMDGVCFSYSDE